MTRTSLKTAIEAADHPILLETPAQLAAAEKSWKGNRILGIDTEFVRERTYRARLGLVQVSDGTTAWLVDPIRLPDLTPLQRMLTDPSITKVLHSSSEDLEVLWHTLAAVPDPMIDTQLACALAGKPLQLAYHAAVADLFDIEVDKEQTRSNWCKRPLTSRQLHYAAMDVVLLPAVVDELRPQLEQSGRWEWLREDIGRMQRVAREPVRPEHAWRRIRGAARLDDTEVRLLRALAAWREETAMARDLARGFVIPDIGLLNLVRARPDRESPAPELEGLHPKAWRRHGATLVKLMREALSDETPLARPQPLTGKQRSQLDRMKKCVRQRAEALGIDPALLGSRRELERLLRAVASGQEIPARFRGWRRSVVGDELLSIIG
ncbi:MAG: ribonuclease D [Xanthomonadales bacterium]